MTTATLSQITDDDVRIPVLLADWHTAARAVFQRQTPALNYDSYAPKRAVYRRKYVLLDEGKSGAFIVERATGDIYRLKSKYDVPNFQKPVGTLGTVPGSDLAQLRWW